VYLPTYFRVREIGKGPISRYWKDEQYNTKLEFPLFRSAPSSNPNASDVWYSDEEINVNDLPRCSDKACGGLLRPDIVWFGEQLNPQYVKMAGKCVYSFL
jgi:NAD-dependent protein deacetylases, SIR2 family